MLNIPDKLKNLYKTDQFPFTDEVTPKDLVIYFPELDLTIETDQIVDDSFELSESLCSESDLIFGSCEAAKIKFTVADVAQDLTGQWFTAHQKIEGYDPVPLGVYKVDSCVKQDNLRFKDITAYNILKDTDIDVAEWYNSLFPNGNETYTLKQFRESLLDYLGIEYEDENLPNDSMIIEKTVDAGQLSAREVLRCCVELQGAFGQVNRYGKFTHKILAETYTDYPQEDYPQEDYPQEEPYEQIYGSMVAQNGIKFEEYTCKPIDKLIIRQEEGDVGCIYGGGTNAYIVQGNFLLYGKSSEELEVIAANIAQNIFNREYRPFTGDLIGLPYLEVGDGVKFNLSDIVTSYVLQRTLTGIQALKDELRAEGNERLEQHFGLNTEIIQLKNKSAILKRTVEELSNTITEIDGDISQLNSKIEQTATSIRTEVSARYANKGLIPSESLAPSEDLVPADSDLVTLTEDYNSKFEQTATSISLEVTRAINAETELSSRIDVMTGQIVLKVDANGNVAAVELDADPSEGTSVKIKADNISLEGLITANGNFKINLDGTIEAVNGKFTGNIISSYISGGSINGAEFISMSNNYEMKINYGNLTFNNYNNNNNMVINLLNIGWQIPGTLCTIIEPTKAQIPTVNCQTISAVGVSRISINSSTNVVGNLSVNDYTVIHAGNIGSQSVRHAINADYATSAGSVPGLTTNKITASDTGYGNIDFLGFDNAAGVNWVQANFQPKTPSDVRLKYDMKPLDLPDELFYSLKPYQFRFKPETNYGDEIRFGLIAQQVESAFEEHGLNPYDYDLIEVVDVRKYTDDGYYVNDTTHRLNDKNFIAWIIDILKKQKAEIENLKTLLKLLEKR